MEIENIPIVNLKPAEYNPRVHDDKLIEKLVKSITTFGMVEPVVINQDNTVIGGHQRLKALGIAGIETAPCVRVDLDKNEEMALNLSLNKLSGEWSIPELKEILTELSSIGMEEFTGFDPDEIAELVDVKIFDEEKDDVVPEPQKEAVSKRGEIYQLGEHRVMCGDSTSKEDVEKLMDGVKADMVFTDPPYNIDYGNIKHHKFKQRNIENDNMTHDEFKVFCAGFVSSIKHSCDGCIYVFGPPGQDGRIMFSILDDALHCSTTIVWNKDCFTLGRGKYQNKYEPCWFGWNKDGSAFIEDRKLTNVWDFPRPKSSKLHPTMKPVEVIENAIGHASSVGSKILDLFLGSGSTLIACEKTGRKCYGMEIDPIYIDVIIKRYIDYVGSDKDVKKIDG